MIRTTIHRIEADGIRVFYRKAGPPDAPVVLCSTAFPHRLFNLAIWGKNDPFFLPAGAQAFARENPNATIRLLDTGHFALETHVDEIAAAMRQLLEKTAR
jgi:hypothetical protein